MSPRRPLGNVSNGAGDIYSNDCVQTEQWWWALDQVAVVADQLSCGWSWSCAWCSVLTFRWARRFFGGQHLSRGEVCVPATSCAFLCVTPRAQPPVFSLFPSQQGYQRYHCTCSELAPSPNFASASRPPAFCAFACRIGLLSALSHTHSACLRFTEVVGCKSRCVAPCWHVPRGSKGAPPPLALERATGTASAHC